MMKNCMKMKEFSKKGVSDEPLGYGPVITWA